MNKFICNALISISIGLVAPINLSAETFSDRLSDATALHKSYNDSGALSVLNPLIQELTTGSDADTSTCIEAVRLKTSILLDNETLQQECDRIANRLFEKSIHVLGPTNDETIKCQELKAYTLERSGHVLEARKIFESTYLYWKNKSESRSSTELAESMFRLGHARDLHCSISWEYHGNSSQHIVPQIKFTETYTSDTLAGIELMKQAIGMCKQIGAPSKYEFDSLSREFELVRYDNREDIARSKQRISTRIIEREWGICSANAKASLHQWMDHHPNSKLYICDSDQAYAFHVGSCYHLDQCRSSLVRISVDRIGRIGRRGCADCDPISNFEYPPDSVSKFDFNGLSYEAQE